MRQWLILNTHVIFRAMAELHRVLKPGATVAILDFNNSTDPTVDGVQAWFLEVRAAAWALKDPFAICSRLIFAL